MDQKILDCEKEINDVLAKHGMILQVKNIPQVSLVPAPNAEQKVSEIITDITKK